MARFPDLGTIFTFTGAGLPTTYTGAALGVAQPVGAAGRMRFMLTLQGAAGTTLTSVQCKIQGQDSLAAGWADVASVLDSSGAIELEHSLTASAGNTLCLSFSLAGGVCSPFGFGNIRVCVKATGSSVAGDTITVTAQAA